MEIIHKNKYIIITIICLITIVAIIVYNINQNNAESEYIEFNDDFENNKVNQPIENIIIEKIKVHVSGEVLYPGVIEIEEGARIIDAINEAGGLTEEADITKVNLAYVLEDAMKIYIPNVNEKDNEEQQIVSSESNISTNKENKTIVNINTASVEELQKISGVGSSIATKIVNYRKQNGKFSSVEDIRNVSGIGDSKYEQIKNYICVK